MSEIWKDVAGYEGLYQVSNLGKVKSLDHYASNGGANILYHGRILSQCTHHGYKYVHLCKNNVAKTHLVHRIVALAFIPNPLGKSQINHKDGNKANNEIYNLEWSSQHENVVHGVMTGLRRLKIPRDKFQYIYEEHMRGRSYRDLADEFHVGRTRIGQIIRSYEHEQL